MTKELEEFAESIGLYDRMSNIKCNEVIVEYLRKLTDRVEILEATAKRLETKRVRWGDEC